MYIFVHYYRYTNNKFYLSFTIILIIINTYFCIESGHTCPHNFSQVAGISFSCNSVKPFIPTIKQ